MSQPDPKNPIAHFIIGVPGSGKSAFAVLIAQTGNYEIISTDEIRQQLYGDETIQGEWPKIEAEALKRIYTALTKGKGVIYDATNYKRAFRIDFLQKVNKQVKSKKVNRKREEKDDFESSTFNLTWIAWHLDTPLETCICWNQQRTRQVPEDIIITMHQVLKNFPPISGEGFAKVNTINVTSSQFSTTEIHKQIQIISRSITNSQNRNANITLHKYSNLIDFERLMYLISLIIKYPGIGNLQNINPTLLENLLGSKPEFPNDLQEIAAIIGKKHGKVYAFEEAINQDLQYLVVQGIIAENENISRKSQVTKENLHNQFVLNTATHSYSDKQAFDRLIGTINLIVNQPFLPDAGGGSLGTFAKELERAGFITNAKSALAMLRKDIENVLKPYKIIPDFPMRNGYFAGTGILTQEELIKVYEILQSQAKSLDDPLLVYFYTDFENRMLQSKLINTNENIYPVRSIAHHSIVDEKHLHETSLLQKLPYLEAAILNGELLELNRFGGSAKYEGDANSFIHVYPLQIVFHNLAWYLGFECIVGEEAGLLRFERLDRLFLGNAQNQFRSRQSQQKSLEKLHKLLKGSVGIFLGNSTSDQRKFLSQDKAIRSQICITIELWFNDKTYRFIIEGTKRFSQIKMSRPQFTSRINLPKSLFSSPTQDKDFPNRFQVVLAKWSIEDFDLWRWIVGFGGNVKVIEPPELVDKVKGIAQGILDNY
ncbi:WYL domain-containing protein [Nostoc sp. PA-18-2419]|uniref:WYL domain-containing protein n=1 Tax=Nostoc sp. PA-18-2419 TaxID=2575443 RepID=UPI001109F7E7|nr:WYL domain-containing protein [Nostoc sp. PA-18-2419]